jgi:hypothetical protein
MAFGAPERNVHIHPVRGVPQETGLFSSDLQRHVYCVDAPSTESKENMMELATDATLSVSDTNPPPAGLLANTFASTVVASSEVNIPSECSGGTVLRKAVGAVGVAVLALGAFGCSAEQVVDDGSTSAEQGMGAVLVLPIAASNAAGLGAGATVGACFATLACGAVVVVSVTLVGTIAWISYRSAPSGTTYTRKLNFPSWLMQSSTCPAIPHSDWLPILNQRFDACQSNGGGSACGLRTYNEAKSLVSQYHTCLANNGGSGCGTSAWVLHKLSVPSEDECKKIEAAEGADDLHKCMQLCNKLGGAHLVNPCKNDCLDKFNQGGGRAQEWPDTVRYPGREGNEDVCR